MQKITPFLWFNNQAEEAMLFYTSIFRNAKAGAVTRYGDAGPGPKGTAMTANFQIEGLDFIALNGGPQYTFTPAISFMVRCDSQEEVDHYWERLTSDGGKPVQCGWLVDKFGVSWQIVPDAFFTLMSSGDAGQSQRVMQAMLQMTKFDIAALERAAAQTK